MSLFLSLLCLTIFYSTFSRFSLGKSLVSCLVILFYGAFFFFFTPFLPSLSLFDFFWASSHLALAALISLILLCFSDIPDKKKNSIVAKIIILSFFLGVTPGLRDYQWLIAFGFAALCAYLIFRFRFLMGLTRGPLVWGLLLHLLTIVLKIKGAYFLIFVPCSLAFFKVGLEHFLLIDLGEEKIA